MKLLFKIEGVRPDRMPGAELAAYMAALARLLGSREYVHFVAIHDESTGIETHIGVKARHIVRQRMRDVDSLSSHADLRRQRDEINDLLARRRTSAKLQEIRQNGSRVNRIEFRGAESGKPELPSIRDHVQVQGILYRIEGRDETVHAGIVDGETRYSAVVSRDQAKTIAREAMFGMVRVDGSALLTRLPNGTWEIGEIEAIRIEPLVETSLAETLEELRAAGGFGWSDDPIGLAALDEMRSSE